MPRPAHPPTPASSTEIRGKDGTSAVQTAVELPPPLEARTIKPAPAPATPAAYHPPTPETLGIPSSEVVKTRRRSSVAQTPSKDAFTLPPPPTRSRKIIQMKPRVQLEERVEPMDGETGAEVEAPSPPPKKKQPSSTSVAGRKIARKTAHSLIERRRRSKMNEEFGVLKDMIPACTGDMHKLAILQASIDYVRYLEDCVAKLSAENNRKGSTPNSDQFMLPPPARKDSSNRSDQDHIFEDDEDVEMEGSDGQSPENTTPTARSHQLSLSPAPLPQVIGYHQTSVSPPHLSQVSRSRQDSFSRQPSISPAMLPQSDRNRQNSYSSASTDPRRYSFASSSATTSPALRPDCYNYTPSTNAGSAFTSPALLPQRDGDQEATAALLMLNADRRGPYGGYNGRGISVKDLLSS